MAKISIIVPVYKVENYIRRCVDSILAQTFTDFELILVDDGSPDNCGKICEEYAKKDERIVVIHKENGGLSDARNAGIDWSLKTSNSRWITFIDSDDWIHPNYLEFLYRAAKNTNCKISICGYNEIREGNGNCVSKSPLLKFQLLRQLNQRSFFAATMLTPQLRGANSMKSSYLIIFVIHLVSFMKMSSQHIKYFFNAKRLRI